MTKRINRILALMSKDPDFIGDSVATIIKELEKAKKSFAATADTQAIENILGKNLKQIDAWTKSRLEMSLGRSIGILKNRQFRQRAVGSQSIMKRVLNAISLQDAGVTKATLRAAIKVNVSLIKTIGSEFFPQIEDKIREGIQKGFSLKTIRKNIQKKLKVSESRARFWARDQVAKTMSGFTKDRQTSAGINGFIWRTLKDERVRGNPAGDSPDAENPHWDQEGKFFTWKEGWKAPDGRTLFPGTDFQCRCFAEPALGPEQATA